MRHESQHCVLEATALDEFVGLGRVGIGLFNRRSQPASGADGSVFLWLCGEFYDQQARPVELTRTCARPIVSDEQLALEVYVREGAAGLTMLDGMFVVAVWDGRARELVLVNDRFGLYPHYFAHTSGTLAFAAEIKGVLEAPNIPRRLDWIALAQYLRFQQLLGERTWFEDVRLLPPASLLRYRPAADQMSITRYWDWDAISGLSKITVHEGVEECARLLQRAVARRTQTPHRVGVYLSGGLDSRAILASVPQHTPVTTLTYGAPGCRDVVYAAQLAHRAGSRHVWFPFTSGQWVIEHEPLHLSLTEGMHSWLHSHAISTLLRARELIDVNLSGLDGRAVLGDGNPGYAAVVALRTDVEVVQQLYAGFCERFTWPGLTESEAEALLSGHGARRLRGLAYDSLRSEWEKTKHYPDGRRLHYFYLQQVVRRSLQTMIVFYRYAVEVRCPYFDYRFIEFVFTLPDESAEHDALRRGIVTRLRPGFATVPNEATDLLPHASWLVHQPYAMARRVQNWINRRIVPIFPVRPRLYADYEDYLRTDMRQWAESILFDTRTEQRGLFDPAAVRSLWERHMRGQELWTIGKIAPLITIERVLRELYDDGDESEIVRCRQPASAG